MSSKPVFVFVPGAWHAGNAWSPVESRIAAKGYKTETVDLACWGAEPPVEDTKADEAVIIEAVQKHLDNGDDVVLVTHSYGGVAGSEALGNLSTTKGGTLKRIVFVTAFAFPEGVCVMDALGGKDLPWWDVQGKKVNPIDPAKIFYNDLSAEEAQKHISGLKHHSYRVFYDPVRFAAWKHYPSMYIVCEDDNAIPLAAQEGMIAQAQGMHPAAFDIVRKMKTSHSPFLSKPDELTGYLLEAA